MNIRKLLETIDYIAEEGPSELLLRQDIRQQLKNPKLHTGDLSNLISQYEDDEHVLYAIATHQKSNDYILDKLSRLATKTKNKTLQAKIAQNPNASPEILYPLSNTPSPYTKVALAKNPSTPYDLLKDMYDYENSKSEPNSFILDALKQRLRVKNAK